MHNRLRKISLLRAWICLLIEIIRAHYASFRVLPAENPMVSFEFMIRVIR